MNLYRHLKRLVDMTRVKQPELLVVGPPRSGFTLLISIINNILHNKKFKSNNQREKLRSAIPEASDIITNSIINFFGSVAKSDALIFAPDFRFFIGGPKWISKTNHDEARVRKYIGLKGYGDILLVINFPKYILEHDNVIHSHYSPQSWVDDKYYTNYLKLSSIRNPIDVINSSVFSLNALTGEYIDNHSNEDPSLIRNNLAKYKLTDLNFIEGLIRPLKKYLYEFLEIRDKYFVMKWEDLISNPGKTISDISHFIGAPLSSSKASTIWSEMRYKNQTAHHRHNFRKGIIGDWKNHLLNEHLEILKANEFDYFLEELGYDKIHYFQEGEYNNFQKEVNKLVKTRSVFQDFNDEDLFTFAFNKSNFQSADYEFIQIKGDRGVEIERSTIKNTDILNGLLITTEKALEKSIQIFDKIRI